MSTLKITFNKDNCGVDKSQISIGFKAGTGSGSVATTITKVDGGEAIKTIGSGATEYPYVGTWYSYDDLKDGVNVTSFSGRIYICYGVAWSVQYAGYEPGQAVTDPNFYLRYDKMELTFTGDPNDVADLTSIDFWSIPMSITTKKGGTDVQTASAFKNGATTQSVYDALLALSNPPVSGIPGPGGPDGTPLKALVPGDFVKYGDGPSPLTTFGRIIGPSSYPPSFPAPGGIPVSPYDTMTDYLTYLKDTFGPGTDVGAVIPGLGAGTIGTIGGNFAGVGSTPPTTGPQAEQTYNLTATIDDDLNVTLTGNCSVVGETTMEFKVDAVKNPTGFYGGNAPYYLNGATDPVHPGNDVYGWITGDLFSGMNIGAVGSSYESGGTMVGAMESSDWFALDSSDRFATLQPDHTYYNQWASTLQGMSDAYNFAYTDRFSHVLISLNPADVDQLEIILEDATVTM